MNDSLKAKFLLANCSCGNCKSFHPYTKENICINSDYVQHYKDVIWQKHYEEECPEEGICEYWKKTEHLGHISYDF